MLPQAKGRPFQGGLSIVDRSRQLNQAEALTTEEIMLEPAAVFGV
jgi:hypothetical protein